MSHLVRIGDIEKSINELSIKKIFERVHEILEVRENPLVRFSDRGVGYVDPLDIIGSTRGAAIIDDYANEARKSHVNESEASNSIRTK